MPSPVNETNIVAPRVPLIDERTGLISREWYRFLLNLFVLTGSGRNDTSLLDLQVGPPTQESQIVELQKQIEALTTTPPLLNSNTLDTNYLTFQVDAPHTNQIGRMGWNSTDQTVDLGMEYGELVEAIIAEAMAGAGAGKGAA